MAPDSPRIAVKSIHRGNAEDPTDSCGDTGVIALVMPATEEAKEIAYTFELMSGEADDLIFFEGTFQGFEDEETKQLQFVFPWLDGATAKQEPLNLVVRVTPYRLSGLKGQPVTLKITDAGR